MCIYIYIYIYVALYISMNTDVHVCSVYMCTYSAFVLYDCVQHCDCMVGVELPCINQSEIG